jgi:hypothetical protein
MWVQIHSDRKIMLCTRVGGKKITALYVVSYYMTDLNIPWGISMRSPIYQVEFQGGTFC